MTLKIAVIESNGSGYQEFLSEKNSDWDWQVPSNSVQEFYDNLDSQKIAEDTAMILIDPDLYDKDNDPNDDYSLERLIAIMSPHALVSMLVFNEVDDTTPQDEIQNRVDRIAKEDAEYSSHFYWIDADDVISSMRTAMEDYVNSGDRDNGTASIIINELNLVDPLATVKEKPKTKQSSKISAYNDDNIFTNTLKRKGTIIAVTSSKGGSGKSTVSYALAQEIGKSTRIAAEQGSIKSGLKVCLVDMDIYDGQLGFVIGANKPTMLSIAHEEHIDRESVARNLITNNIVQIKKKSDDRFIEFSALLAPKSPRYVEDTPADMYQQVINILTTMFDIVILDTSVMYFLDPIIYDVAYPIADKILYVTDLDIKSILGMTRWLQTVCPPEEDGGYGIGMEKIGIVINKGMNQVGMSPTKIMKIIGISAKHIYQSIDPTLSIDEIPTPHILTTVPSYPKLITGASNSQNLGKIIESPAIEEAIRRLAVAVLPLDIAKSLVNVSNSSE